MIVLIDIEGRGVDRIGGAGGTIVIQNRQGRRGRRSEYPVTAGTAQGERYCLGAFLNVVVSNQHVEGFLRLAGAKTKRAGAAGVVGPFRGSAVCGRIVDAGD